MFAVRFDPVKSWTEVLNVHRHSAGRTIIITMSFLFSVSMIIRVKRNILLGE